MKDLISESGETIMWGVNGSGKTIPVLVTKSEEEFIECFDRMHKETGYLKKSIISYGIEEREKYGGVKGRILFLEPTMRCVDSFNLNNVDSYLNYYKYDSITFCNKETYFKHPEYESKKKLNDLSNVNTCCMDCNTKKGVSSLDGK